MLSRKCGKGECRKETDGEEWRVWEGNQFLLCLLFQLLRTLATIAMEQAVYCSTGLVTSDETYHYGQSCHTLQYI